MTPVWLYVPQRPEILQQLVQLNCETSVKQARSWINQLDQIGLLAIKGDTAQHVLHALFQKTTQSPRCSTPNVVVSHQQLDDLHSTFIQFHPAPFLYGYLFPTYLTATPMAQSMDQVQVPSSNIIESLPSAASSTFELQSMANTDLDHSSYRH
ncbi:hypothetical protein P692DRAFT_20822085 [Suillus brevipes Sb2]|nr:hypothetical protein P692DRAFT_20822085 [Suillus brevipes Sb2]